MAERHCLGSVPDPGAVVAVALGTSETCSCKLIFYLLVLSLKCTIPLYNN